MKNKVRNIFTRWFVMMFTVIFPTAFATIENISELKNNENEKIESNLVKDTNSSDYNEKLSNPTINFVSKKLCTVEKEFLWGIRKDEFPHWEYELFAPRHVSDSVGYYIRIADSLISGNKLYILYKFDSKSNSGGRVGYIADEDLKESWRGEAVDFKFFNEKIGFLTKTSGHIYITENGGKTWHLVDKDLPEFEMSIGLLKGNSKVTLEGNKIVIEQELYTSEDSLYARRKLTDATQKVKSYIFFVSDDKGKTWKLKKIEKFEDAKNDV